MPDNEPPESLILAQFQGVVNTIAEERLQPGQLASAVNVDIDDAGQLRRRRGYRKVAGGAHHSLANVAGRTLVVRDRILGFLNEDHSHTALVPVGDDPLSYTAVGKDIYYSSRSAYGKIVDGQARAWGTAGETRWVSPVVTPTETLGAISGRQLSAPPPHATEIEHYKGRIYLAAGPVLWNTELYAYDFVDKDKNYVLLEDDITMLQAVSSGLYVGTTAELLFLSGTAAKGLAMRSVMASPVIPGSGVRGPVSKAHPAARSQPVPEDDGPMFMTEAGICLGLDGGQVYNLTQGRTIFPGAVRGAALYREDQGANTYIAVADSAGGPQANARIGDYVDAEIIRASQRGKP